MELVSLLVIGLLVLIGVKLLGLFLKFVLFLITLPIQLLALMVVGLVLLFLVPFGIFGMLVGLVAAPLVLLKPLIPLLLVLVGLYLIVRHQRS
jgi:hypothetical protein